MTNEHLKILKTPDLKDAVVVVTWSADVTEVGFRISDYLNRHLHGEKFAEIGPVGFFPLDGINIEDSLVKFPRSEFFTYPGKSLVLLQSSLPGFEWHKFLSSILDAVQQHCHVKELYTLGGIMSAVPHTAARQIMSISNSANLKRRLKGYEFTADLDYESPLNQRPSLSSFLAWLAARRGVAAATLWVLIPFYLAPLDNDPMAQKAVLDFLDRRCDLGIDFTDLNEEIYHQGEKLAQVRQSQPDIDKLISRLEDNLTLTEEESEKLVKEVETLLNKEAA